MSIVEINPKVVSDISCWLLFEKKQGNIYCVGSIEKDKYIQIPEKSINEVMTCIKYFDGDHSISNIETILKNEYHIIINASQLYDILCKANLIENNTEKNLIEKQEFEKLSVTIFKLNLSSIYEFINKIEKSFLNKFLYITIPVIIIGTIMLLLNFQLFLSSRMYKVSESYILGFSIMIIVFLLSIFLHELGHALLACRYHLKPKEIIFGLYLGITPIIYLKIPGLYTIERKKRIVVWASGVYINLFIGSLCMIGSIFATGSIKNILLMCSVTNYGFLITNLSPLLPLDGYFILSTLLKIPNIRKNSFKEFKKFIFLRKNEFRGVLIIYFLFTTLFMASLFGSQLYWIVDLIIQSYKRNQNLMQVILEFKAAGIIIALIIFKLIVEKIVKYHRSQNLLQKI